MQNKPKAYSPTTPSELEAVSTLEFLLDKRYIKPFFNKHDKIPNHDGRMDITDEKQYPIGEILVQIKTYNRRKKLKHSFSSGFIEFCVNSQLPLVAFLVDTHHKVAYWKYFNGELLAELSLKNSASHSVTFSEDCTIKENNKDYINDWMSILKKERENKTQRHVLKKEIADLKKTLKTTKILKDNSYQISDERFIHIHKFIDYYNSLLDHEFNSLKNMFYPSIWKIGIAINEFTEYKINFIKYPVPMGTNDTLIKLTETDNKERILQSDAGWIGYYVENPILRRPKGYAFELISHYAEKALTKGYVTSNHIAAIQELLIQFIDDFHSVLGVQPGKEKYPVQSVFNGLIIFIGLLLEETGFIKDHSLFNQINIDNLAWRQDPGQLKSYKEKAKERMDNGESIQYDFEIFSEYYNLDHVRKALSQMQFDKMQNINRQFSYKHVHYWHSIRGSNYGNPLILKKNLKYLFTQLPLAYNSVIQNHFPSLFNELNYFASFNRVIVVAGIGFDPPFVIDGDFEVNIIYLQNLSSPTEDRIDTFVLGVDKEIPLSKKDLFKKKEIKIDSQIYKIISWEISSADFIFVKMPINAMVNKILKNRLEKYFKNKIEK